METAGKGREEKGRREKQRERREAEEGMAGPLSLLPQHILYAPASSLLSPLSVRNSPRCLWAGLVKLS